MRRATLKDLKAWSSRRWPWGEPEHVAWVARDLLSFANEVLADRDKDETVCAKCGLRQNDKHEKGDF